MPAVEGYADDEAKPSALGESVRPLLHAVAVAQPDGNVIKKVRPPRIIEGGLEAMAVCAIES